VVELAAERKVEVVALSRYVSGKSRRNGLILGFAAVDPKELRRGVEELARVLCA
jgi:DNA-binding transcriptional MocR family regulator